jgi:ferredoxin-NADP reductase
MHCALTLFQIYANNQYRISVKNEPDGRVSSALHNSLHIGDTLEAKAPKGSFILKQNKRITNIFIAAGIGITPILSMLKSIQKSKETIHLILAVKEENLLNFKEEIHKICTDHPNIKVDLFFSQKPVENLNKIYSSWQYHNKRLNIESLKTILPNKKNFSFYICGPEKMNRSLIAEINLWKGKRAKIYTENFGIEKSTKNRIQSDKEIQVHFTKSNKTVTWDHDYNNILEFAESNGVSLEAGCMFGECGACSLKIGKGSVGYNYHTAVKPVKGNCLPCSCHPTSDLSLDV